MRRSIVTCSLLALVAAACSSREDPRANAQPEQPTCYEPVDVRAYGKLLDLDAHGRLLVRPTELPTRDHRPFVWDAGKVTRLSPPPRDVGPLEDWSAEAKEMNDAGDVLGLAGLSRDQDGVPGGARIPVESSVVVWHAGRPELVPFPVELPSYFTLHLNELGHVTAGTDPPGVAGYLRRGSELVSLGAIAPRDLNAHDDVVGLDADGRPVLFHDGALTRLSDRAAGDLFLNDRVQVAMTLDVDGTPHAYFWDGTLHDLGAGTIAQALSENGDVALVRGRGTGTERALVSRGGSVEELGMRTGFRASTASDVNASSVVVGLGDRDAFAETEPDLPVVWHGLVMDELTVVRRGAERFAGVAGMRINDAGMIAGTLRIDEATARPLLWRPTSCGGPPPPEEPTE